MSPPRRRTHSFRRRAEQRLTRVLLLCIAVVVTLLSTAVAFATNH